MFQNLTYRDNFVPINYLVYSQVFELKFLAVDTSVLECGSAKH